MREWAAVTLTLILAVMIGNFLSEIAIEAAWPFIFDWLYGPFEHPMGELP